MPRYAMSRPDTWDTIDPCIGQGTEDGCFNPNMREALAGQGFSVIHLRETNEPGKADLVVYHQTFQEGFGSPQVIDAWLELKMTPSIEGTNIRPAQREFMRQHWRRGRNAIFVMYDPKTDLLVLRQGDLLGGPSMVSSNPYKVNWREVFEHFAQRKVSLT